MSYCFYIQAVKAPSLAEWLNACALPDVIRVQGKNNPWPESSQFFCRKLLSTRGILLSHKDARLEIRTNILSAPADYQLAFSLATAAAKMTGKEIVPESAQAMNVETFMSVHDDKWILDMNLSNVRSLRAIIDEGNTFSIPGPFRNTLLGPQKLKQLTAATETDTLQNLLALLLRITMAPGRRYPLPPHNSPRKKVTKNHEHWQFGFPKRAVSCHSPTKSSSITMVN